MTTTASPEPTASQEPNTKPAPPTIALDHVSLRRDDVQVLSDITLTFAERRITILGPNGSGKSSLLRLLNGLLTPTTGVVKVGIGAGVGVEVRVGENLDTAHDAKQIRRAVGFVFQNPDNQIVMPTVAEDIAFGLHNLRIDPGELDRRLDEVLARLQITHLKHRQTSSLSGGEKQLLALASVLVMEPSSIVFDEPTTMLDLRNSLRIRAEIAGLPQQAIIATHDLDLAAETDRAIVLDGGQVAFDGAPAAAIDFYQDLCTRQ